LKKDTIIIIKKFQMEGEEELKQLLKELGTQTIDPESD
jgi:hypothetical protein